MANVSVANSDAGLAAKTIDLLESDQTITGLKTFNRGAATPFAVQAGSLNVANLDSDKLDGQDGSYYTNADNLASGTVAIARGGTGAATAAARKAFIGPISGAAAAPSFRILEVSDLPNAAKDTTVLTISNDNTEQTAFTGTVTGNTLGANGGLWIVMSGEIFNNTAGTVNYNVRIKFGATTLLAGNIAVSNNANSRGHRVEFYLHNTGATNAQRVQGFTWLGDTAASGAWSGGLAGCYAGFGSSAIDTTADVTLAVTVQLDTASANATYNARSVFVQAVG